ncbi:MAG TPA: cytochrome-c peroxidase [Polyangiaceae bacterium]|nr:cytochrome-c peroxidase [Polyangiaceae bacterium]
MAKNSGICSVLGGLVALGALAGCSGPSDSWTPVSSETPLPPTTTSNGQPVLFAGKTIRSTTKAAPVAGGTLLVTKDGYAVASDPDRDLVHVVDIAKQSVVSVPLEVDDEPGRVVEGPASTVYVAARRGGVVIAVNTAEGTAQRLKVCTAPRGLAFDATLSRLYVACRSGVLAVMDTTTNEVTNRYRLDADLRDVLISGDHLAVTRFKSAELLVVSREGKVLRRAQPRAQSITGASVTPSVAFRALGLPGGGVLVGHVDSSNTTLPSGAGAYYGSFCGGSVADVAVSAMDPYGGSDHATLTTLAGTTLGGASGPLDVALAADGSRVAMLATGNSWTPLNNPQRPTNLWISSVNVLKSGGFSSPCGSVAGAGMGAATRAVAGEPVAVAFDAGGQWVAQSREPAQLEFESGLVISLAADSRFDTGFAMFHMNTGGGIACTSCHPEAGEDGHTWNFSVGPRRSQTLEGGASTRAPFHWTGDLTTFDDLVDEVMLKRMSLPASVDLQQRAALRDWLDSVPKSATADDLDADAVERGRVLFGNAELACATCHSGTDFTDNKPHDVGTGAAFITPSLVDVNVRAPLFHDGCALTLEARFGPCGGGDAHGKTSGLTRAQEADLVAYMQSL